MAEPTTGMQLPSAEYLAENEGTGVVVCASIFIAVEVLVVTTRLVTKHFTAASWGWDDYLLAPTLLFAVTLNSIYIWQPAHLGFGRHEIAVLLEDPSKIVRFAKFNIATTCLIALALCTARFSTLAAYLRFLTGKAERAAAWFTIALNLCIMIMSVCLNLAVCVPMRALWDPSVTDAHCINEFLWWGLATVPSIVLDAMVIAIPMRTVCTLKIPTSERVGLIIAFVSYGAGTVATIVRTSIFLTRNGTVDPTWNQVPLTYATICENGTYIIAACVPGIRPLYLQARGKHVLSRRSARGTSRGVDTTDTRVQRSYTNKSEVSERSISP